MAGMLAVIGGAVVLYFVLLGIKSFISKKEVEPDDN